MTASSADLPSRKAAPVYTAPEPVATWTGFYAGVNAGGSWSGDGVATTSTGPVFADPGFPHTDPADTPFYLGAASAAASGVNPANYGGFIGGGQIGYNYQLARSFVVGLEADIQGLTNGGGASSTIRAANVGADPANNEPSNYLALTTARKSVDYLGTVRGRVGVLATPTLLLFGSGGLAYGGVNLSGGVLGLNDFFFAQPSNVIAGPHMTAFSGATNYATTRVGWTAGGGAEWMFWPGWSAKVEYLYYDLGTASASFVMPHVDNNTDLRSAFLGKTSASFNGHVVRAGLNYHLNFGAIAPFAAQ